MIHISLAARSSHSRKGETGAITHECAAHSNNSCFAARRIGSRGRQQIALWAFGLSASPALLHLTFSSIPSEALCRASGRVKWYFWSLIGPAVDCSPPPPSMSCVSAAENKQHGNFPPNVLDRHPPCLLASLLSSSQCLRSKTVLVNVPYWPISYHYISWQT